MPRPKRLRRILSRPQVRQFGPPGKGNGEPVLLSHEEFEAVRLIDYLGLDQSQASEIMGVSRQTVGRILRQGRFKLSSSIVEARHLKVDGGCYRVSDAPDRNIFPAKGSGFRKRSCEGNGRKRRCGRGRRGQKPPAGNE